MPSLPSTMRAVIAPTPGGPEALALVERPVPAPADGDVLIAVRAAGLNRADLLQRQGKYPPPAGASDVLGMEVAGEVAAVGPGAARFKPGDRVMALLPAGGYAEFAIAPEGVTMPIPEGLSFAEAAGIPEAALTVWDNVFQRGALKAGETILIHGGASGIGTFAIQIARAFGARVITTAGSAEKCAVCRKLGAEVAIDYPREDFVAATREATAGRGADVILDIIGGAYVTRNFMAAAEEGRVVQIATQEGARADVDLRPLIGKRLTFTGSLLRPRSTALKAALTREVARHVLPLIRHGGVMPVIDATFPLGRAADAHRRLEAREHIGKVALTIP